MNSFLSEFSGKMTNVELSVAMAHFLQPGLDYFYSRGGS